MWVEKIRGKKSLVRITARFTQRGMRRLGLRPTRMREFVNRQYVRRNGLGQQRDLIMDSALIIGLSLAGFVGFALALRKLVEWIGFSCQFCDAKVQPLRRIDQALQEEILQYFYNYERRKPDQSGIFVCLNCKTIHDDFSGEKQSRDPDKYNNVTFCKVCNAAIWRCEPKNDSIQCPRCQTPYIWQTYEDSEFRFLMPPEDAKLLKHGRMGLDSR